MGFLRYHDVEVTLDGDNIFAETASIGVTASTKEVRHTDGTIFRYAPTNGLRGQLELEYYMTGSLNSNFDPVTATETAMNGTFAGLSFSQAHVTAMAFSMAPYRPIRIKNTFDFYSDLSSTLASSFEDPTQSAAWGGQGKYAHSTVSYLAGLPNRMNETISFNYSSAAQRTPVYLIGETTPTRVTLEQTQLNMRLRGSDIGGVLQTSGTNANITCYLEDINSRSNITNFNINGEIINQTLDVSQGGYLEGEITVSQVYR
jgi:hypothetical protein